MSLFCRHNRFTADCPICSKGTVLEEGAKAPRRASPAAGRTGAGRRAARAEPPPAFSGPYAAAGPYQAAGEGYEVRLESVPGGVRLAEWGLGGLRRRAPVLAAEDVRRLVLEAAARDVLGAGDAASFQAALATRPEGGTTGHGASPGRSGELRDELRVERLEGGQVRIARWVLRPNFGWELQEAPVMLPAARYAEALERAAAAGVLASA